MIEPLALGKSSLRLLETFLRDKQLLAVRQRYFEEPNERLGSLNLIEGAFDNSRKKIPLCCPLQTTFDVYVSTLIKKKIYFPNYWPTLANNDLNKFELRLKNQALFLPLSNIKVRSNFIFLLSALRT